ncbi:hypothetical protein [Streptomyces botrytidirepellens]|uniref:hypothetical protein n=1 Tax=Streptomyces botrytidirepellens TaxID=2486417 RepID=UPI00161BF341|nr:hypothetical protein [Streptomyces botrytidirepellens]
MALVEIDLYGELMIAAASADEDRLSPDRIDEVLRVEADRSAGRSADRSADRTAERSDSANRSTGRTTENAERPETDGPDAG